MPRLPALFVPLVALGASLLPARAEAVPCGLFCQTADGNTMIAVNPASDEGLLSWVVDGTQHGFQEWYWIGDGAGGESSLDDLTLVGKDQASSITLDYTTGDLDINVVYGVAGGAPGSGASVLTKSVTVTNSSTSSQSFSWFEYTDLDLNFSDFNDSASATSATEINQTEGATSATARQLGTAPDAWQIDQFPDLRDDLEDLLPTALDSSGSIVNGDVTYAWQWNVTLAPGQDFTTLTETTLDSGLVPEPDVLALLGSGLFAFALLRRRT